MPLETSARIVHALADRGYNAEREAVTLLADAADPGRALERALETVPEDAVVLTAEHVRTALDGGEPAGAAAPAIDAAPAAAAETPSATPDTDPSVSGGGDVAESADGGGAAPVETGGSAGPSGAGASADPRSARGSERSTGSGPAADADAGTPAAETGEGTDAGDGPRRNVDPSARSIEVEDDMTGRSTGTGEYRDFVSVFRDRYERLSKKLRGRVNHRPTDALESMPGNSDAAIVGMVSDVRSTAGGHWLVELEDTNGVFPCLIMKDRPFADLVDELLYDEVIAVEGTLADDGGILFVDAVHFPDVPRTHEPATADRQVRAALISDVHVGSQEFVADAWSRFADWLHTDAASDVEYLLIAGDMVEGVGVYPDQDEELDVVDIYDQYERFSEHLKEVPGDMEIRMIPGNHDAVRLAEPQPAFDEELREIMTAHDASVHSNPSTVTVEGVSVLLYHGVSLDEVIAEMPEEKASYDRPHEAMYRLLRKRHVAPQYGGHTRLAPEKQDYLVIDEVPDVFHTGHVHKLGWGKYHGVLAINSGCWQAQTAFQESVNIDPDAGFAPILDLSTLDLTVRKFR